MFRKSSTFLLVMILSLALTVPALAAPLSAATTISGGNVSGTWDGGGCRKRRRENRHRQRQA